MSDDDDIWSPEVRWGGRDYGAGDFVLDPPSALESVANGYLKLDVMAADAAEQLLYAHPPEWTGAAKQAYERYLSEVTTYLQTITETGFFAYSAAKACQRALQSAVDDAAGAANTCNQARARAGHKPPIHSLGSGGGPGTGSHDPAEEQMSAGMRAGKAAARKARDALNKLIADLDPLDHKLATQREPSIPNTNGLEGDQLVLLNTIVRPMSDALKRFGDTRLADDLVSRYQQAMQNDPSGRQARQVLDIAAGMLSGPELDYFFSRLDADDVAAGFGKLDPEYDRNLYNVLAGKASLETLATLADTDPNHYWHPATGTNLFIWSSADSNPNQPPSADLSLLDQGSVGDCYLLASLGAVTARDPNFLSNHVHPNPNGTYTVTVYKDGKPVEVTVTPDVPYYANADGSPRMAAFAGHGAGNDMNLYQIYEKALAQADELGPFYQGDGYQGLDGGNAVSYLPVITGKDADLRFTTIFDGPGSLANAVQSGHPVVVGTRPFGGPGFDHDHPPYLITSHVYYVDHVDLNAHPPTVTVVNPWGRDDPKNGTLTLTWNQFKSAMTTTATGAL